MLGGWESHPRTYIRTAPAHATETDEPPLCEQLLDFDGSFDADAAAGYGISGQTRVLPASVRGQAVPRPAT